jgi:hypothetical protein
MPTRKKPTSTIKQPVRQKAQKAESTTSIEISKAPAISTADDLYRQLEIGSDTILKLELIATQIESHRQTAIEATIAIGKAALEARDLLSLFSPNKIQANGFIKWAETRICQPNGFTYQTLVNFMNVADRLPQDTQSLTVASSLNPSALYELVRPTFPEELRQKVIQAAPPQLTREQVKSIKDLNQLAEAQQKKLQPKAISALLTVPALPNTDLARIARLDPEEQISVATEIAQNREAGIELLRYKDRERKTASVNFDRIPLINGLTEISSSISELPDECIDTLVVEAPLSSDWAQSENGLSYLDKVLDRVLAPSAFAIIFLGHRSILFSGQMLSYLQPLTILTARRTPGNTPMLPGINLGYSAVHAVLAYKPPMRKTAKMTFDLQSFSQEETPPGELANISTGIEVAICNFLDALTEEASTLAHLQIGARGYSLREPLANKASELKANTFYSLKL